MSSIGERIKKLQDEFQLNNVELAEIAGVTKAAVGRWRNHNVMPDPPALIAMREKLGVSDVWILYGRGPMKVTALNDPFTQAVASMAEGLDDRLKAEILDYVRYKAEQSLKRSQE